MSQFSSLFLQNRKIPNKGANGHLIISAIKQGITYKYAAVIDSTMDVLGSFYSSLPTDLEMTESAVEFLLEPLDGMAFNYFHSDIFKRI